MLICAWDAGGRRQVFAVDGLQQPVHGDDPVGAEQKRSQDDLLPGTAQLKPF